MSTSHQAGDTAPAPSRLGGQRCCPVCLQLRLEGVPEFRSSGWVGSSGIDLETAETCSGAEGGGG